MKFRVVSHLAAVLSVAVVAAAQEPAAPPPRRACAQVAECAGLPTSPGTHYVCMPFHGSSPVCLLEYPDGAVHCDSTLECGEPIPAFTPQCENHRCGGHMSAGGAGPTMAPPPPATHRARPRPRTPPHS